MAGGPLESFALRLLEKIPAVQNREKEVQNGSRGVSAAGAISRKGVFHKIVRMAVEPFWAQPCFAGARSSIRIGMRGQQVVPILFRRYAEKKEPHHQKSDPPLYDRVFLHILFYYPVVF
jgi:hypothetical protein